MYSNFFNTAIRNIFKYKMYSMINVIGLAVGMAVCMMIMLFVRHEVSFESMFPRHNDIYRINWTSVGTGAQFATFFNPASPPIAESLSADIEAFTRVAYTNQQLVVGEDKTLMTLSFVDKSFFNIFPYAPVEGNLDGAIDGMNTAVLTRAAAVRLFGTDDAVDKIFSIRNEFEYRVSAVVEDSPTNSHLTANVFINIEQLPAVWGRPDLWENAFSDSMYHYLLLRPEADGTMLGEKIMQFVEANFFESARQYFDITAQPLDDIHFTTYLQNEAPLRDELTGTVKPLRQKTDIYIFGSVAGLTLLIAAFNFMNLQIAQASKRIREVGIRKVLGASRKDVAVQFLLESMLLSIVALFIAFMLVELFLPFFTELVTSPVGSSALYDPAVNLSLVGVALLVGILSGLYPALFIAGLVPTQVLRGELVQGVGAGRIRAVLVVLQFAISIGLIASTDIVNAQISYAFSKSLGFEADQVITVSLPTRAITAHYPAMKERLLTNPNILSVSASSVIPTGDLSDGSQFQISGGDPDAPLAVRSVYVDYDYFETLGMTILAGRAFDRNFVGEAARQATADNPNVEATIVLNETAARNAGWTNYADAIGKQLSSSSTRNDVQYSYTYTIVGIVADAHFGSIRTEISPMSYNLAEYYNDMIIKARPDDMAATLASIDTVWSDYVSDRAINKSFLDETYASLYSEESKTFRLFMGFAGIAAAIACLGLYGLASFMAERRVKEIGIRKVLGAKIRNIISLLSWDFSKLVLIANLIAWPIAYYLMHDWLQTFAYRISMDINSFVIAGVLALMLAVGTVSIRAYKAASVNPIQSLRYE